MALIARIIGCSLLTAGLWAGFGFAVFGRSGVYSDFVVPTLVLACAGGITGAIAGVGREIVIVLRQRGKDD